MVGARREGTGTPASGSNKSERLREGIGSALQCSGALVRPKWTLLTARIFCYSLWIFSLNHFALLTLSGGRGVGLLFSFVRALENDFGFQFRILVVLSFWSRQRKAVDRFKDSLFLSLFSSPTFFSSLPPPNASSLSPIPTNSQNKNPGIPKIREK